MIRLDMPGYEQTRLSDNLEEALEANGEQIAIFTPELHRKIISILRTPDPSPHESAKL